MVHSLMDTNEFDCQLLLFMTISSFFQVVGQYQESQYLQIISLSVSDISETIRPLLINELLQKLANNMNKITFHNRNRIIIEYSALYGCRRCISCELQYQPHNTRSQNTLLIMDCNHLIHRQCLKNNLLSMERHSWTTNCNLCRAKENFEKMEEIALLRVIERKKSDRLEKFQIAKNVWVGKEEYEDIEESIYYEKFIHQVEKKGKYTFK